MAKVTLDLETFKALASTTRLQVLRCLDERRKTLSEIAKEMELNKATVHEHLALLVATGLVDKKDEGRKWIYYELTWRGERLLHPQETTTFSVLLGLAAAAGGGGFLMLGKSLEWWMADRAIQGMGEGVPETDDQADQEAAAPADDQSQSEPDSGNNGDADTADDPQGAPSSNELATGDGDSSGDEADMDTGGSSFFDEDGILSILLFCTAVLLGVLATIVRRTYKKS